MSIDTQHPRYCDLYNLPEEDCECKTVCGLPHDSCPDHSTASPMLSTKPASRPPTPSNEHGESAKEILDKYEKYNEFMSIFLALSTSAFTSALQQYRTTVSESGFGYEDREVLEEFANFVKLSSSGGDGGEVDVYELAEAMAGNHLAYGDTRAAMVVAAAKKYRMILQWYGGKVGVDEDILRDVQSILARVQEWCESWCGRERI